MAILCITISAFMQGQGIALTSGLRMLRGIKASTYVQKRGKKKFPMVL
jgi:hypothetical protein